MNSKQVVLITGSSTGFGRLFTATLARKGHTVFATMRDPGGRNAKNASEIRTLAEKDSLPIYVLELDVTDDASVERAVDAAVAKAGRIDVAINNAGYYLVGLEEAVTTEQARRLMDTNFLGPVRVNRAVLPHMRRQRRGVQLRTCRARNRIRDCRTRPIRDPYFREYGDGCRRGSHRYVRRRQRNPREAQRGPFLHGRKCSGSRGHGSADYRDSRGREAVEVFRQPPELRCRRDQRPHEASASQRARSLRPCCRHEIPQG